MARPLRYVPAGSVAHVTGRTLHGRMLLRPSAELNEIILGILGRAQRRYRMRICAFVFVSNHFLCAAAHKKCYVEPRIMWSWRRRSRSGGSERG